MNNQNDVNQASQNNLENTIVNMSQNNINNGVANNVMPQNNINDVNNQNENNDKGSFGWAILGFFIPLVGLILFIAWNKRKHKSAKMAGIGALISVILSIIVTVLLVFLGASMFSIYQNETTNNDNEYNIDINENQKADTITEENSTDTDGTQSSVLTQDLLSVNYKGVKISFPTTWEESFSKTGLTWKKSQTELASGYTTSGGRIGDYPGGVVVTVENHSSVTQKFQDCIIDSGTFYPESDNDNTTFVGGLNFNSTIEEVKAYFEGAGYKNCEYKDTDGYEGSSYTYKCYLNDDATSRLDYIYFTYINNKIDDIMVNANGSK